MDIEAPDEFLKACRNLVQGLDVATAEEFVDHALIGIDQQEAVAIKNFLDDFLSRQYSADELRDWWWSTSCDIVFYEGEGVTAFLKLLRERLGKPPYADAETS